MTPPIAWTVLFFSIALVTSIPAQTRTLQDGVFTEEQARRGEAVNEGVCLECHEPDEFIGSFLQSWSGAPVSMLFDEVSALMPEDRPGTLRPQEYVDVLAYIFSLNGIPTGAEELGTAPEILQNIIIEWEP